jgi:hypothetical protein
VRRKDDPIDILFNFQISACLNDSFSVQLNTTLPQGPEYDSYNMHIFIRIIDDSEGVSEYLIPTAVKVVPLTLSTLMNEINNDDSLSESNKKLYEGDLLEASQIISYLSIMLNSECYDDKNRLVNSGN